MHARSSGADDPPSARRGAPTLKDVAALAGVSLATASKAMNGRADVKPSTRQRVLDAAERIAFVPNALATGLLAGTTGTVGLLTSDLVGRFSIPILMGAEDAFGAGKVAVFLCDARGDAIRENYQISALLRRRIDGLIVVGSRTDPRRPLTQDLPVPVVYAYAPSLDDQDISVAPDNVGAGALAARHLLSVGRRRIAHITGDATYAAARERAAGATAELAGAGCPLVGEVLYGSWSEAWGRAGALAVLDAHPDVDAVLCGSDQVARGALDALRDSGRAVPDDVAVLGFDNWSILVDDARPPLTSIDMQLEALGRLAARRLFQAIDGEWHRGVETTPCRLVVRASTAVGA